VKSRSMVPGSGLFFLGCFAFYSTWEAVIGCRDGNTGCAWFFRRCSARRAGMRGVWSSQIPLGACVEIVLTAELAPEQAHL